MAQQKKHIGVFFGIDSLSFVETKGSDIIYSESFSHTFSPLQTNNETEQAPENIRLTAAIQRIVREQKIQNPSVNLSLPVRNILFRAFTVPFMNTSEIATAVEFEARKYIPFKLDELVYGYHHIQITENETKKIRILFIAIRKNVLTQYCNIFEEGKIKIASIEPSSISLLRILKSQKHLESNQKIAIIQINDGEGAITIAEQQIPQFIRDFKLPNPKKEKTIEETQEIFVALFDEIRVSLDFYARQFKKRSHEHDIDKIFIFSNHYPREIAERLKTDLNVPTVFFDSNNVFGTNEKLTLNTLNAVGTSFTEECSLNLNLDLAKARNSNGSSADSDLDSFFNQTPNYKLTAKIAFACGLIVGLAFLAANALGLPQSTKIKTLTEESKKYAFISTADLQTKTSNFSKKIKVYESIRFHSDVTKILTFISGQTPDGVWLKNFNIGYLDSENIKEDEEPEIEIVLEGYAYASQLNNQIHLIDDFIAKLKSDKDLKDQLKHLELETVGKTEKEGFPLTYFKILIKLENKTNDRS
ncbi:MAG: pilus assembly protein PilM [Candidatus Omnitrophica bacterium]|nr:pilus assembly protein PilM [Candidatus Omnitrophota bacterium]